MKKSDLKCGQVVELRNNTLAMKLGNNFIYFDGYDEIEDWDEDLKESYTQDKNMDIMGVYDIKNGFNFMHLSDKRKEKCFLRLIWERKEIPKLTQIEIVLLEALPKDYGYIARDEDKELGIFESKPRKFTNWKNWDAENNFTKADTFHYPHLFNFIKWEDDEPWKISELIAGQK